MKIMILPLALLFAAAPSLVHAQSEAYPSFEACGFESSFVSADGAPMDVTFIVETNVPGPINLHWVDYNGNRQFFETIWPGDLTTITTAVGHGWVGDQGANCAYIRVDWNAQRVIFAFDDYN